MALLRLYSLPFSRSCTATVRRGVLDCACARKPDCEEARLLAGLPEVLLPVRSVKC